MVVLVMVIQIGLALLAAGVGGRTVHRIRGRNVLAGRIRHGDLDLLVQPIAGSGRRLGAAAAAAAQARRKARVPLGRRAADAGGGAVRAAVALVLMVLLQMMVAVVRMRAQLVARAATAMDAQRQAFLLEAVAGAFEEVEEVDGWAVVRLEWVLDGRAFRQIRTREMS